MTDSGGGGGSSSGGELLRRVAALGDIEPPVLLAAGDHVGRFRILGLLGRGGMGVVYRAEDETLRREVALKLVAPSRGTDEGRRRLLREAQAAAAITHPNVATVYDVGEDAGRVFVAMELIEGESLRQVLGARRLGVDETISLAREIAAAVAQAHARGIVHRDLKPENVMVTGGHAKVLDFGLAKRRSVAASENVQDASTSTALTIGGAIVGTPSYMAPEQARGEEADERTDVFAIGLLTYEMLAGRRAFEGNSVADVVSSILRDEPRALRAVRGDVPAWLAGVVSRCLEKRGADRFANAGDLLAALEQGGAKQRTARRWSPLTVAIVSVAVVIAAVAVLATSRSGSQRGAAAVAAASSTAPAPPSPAPTAVTDLPMPSSSSVEALAAYRAALQANRDGTSSVALLLEALRADPGLADAELRLSILTYAVWQGGTVSDARAHYERARSLRASLSPRDRLVLEAYEPMIARDPTDPPEHERRLLAATQAYPADAELFFLYATALRVQNRFHEARAAFAHAAEIDPHYVAALRLVAQSFAENGEDDEARAALDRCLTVRPGAVACLQERMWLDETVGRCQDVVRDAKLAIANSLQSAYWPLSNASAALGEPRGSLETMVEARIAALPVERRTREEGLARAALAIFTGRFDEATKLLDEARTATAASLSLDVHGAVDLARVGLLLEEGDLAGAGRIAKDFADRTGAWGVPRSAEEDPTPFMLSIATRARLASADDLRAARASWIGAWAARFRPDDDVAATERWYSAWGLGAFDRASALVALEAAPKTFTRVTVFRRTTEYESLGRALVLAGRPGEAIAPLGLAAGNCNVLDEVLANTRAHYWLGVALGRTGDKGGACEQLAVVVSRWGRARPRAVTAQSALAEAGRLGCDARP